MIDSVYKTKRRYETPLLRTKSLISWSLRGAMSFTLALQPVLGDGAQQKSIQQLITRINEERGAFRNVTEETLLDELAKASTGSGDDDLDEGSDAVDSQDIEARRKEVYTARNEMLKFIGYDSSFTTKSNRLTSTDRRRTKHSQPSTSYRSSYPKNSPAQKPQCHPS